MTMELLLMLLCAGHAAGFQLGVSYVYRYQASVELGIPGINANRGAVMNIRGDLRIWTPDRMGDPFKVKLDNVEFTHRAGALSGEAPEPKVGPEIGIGARPFSVPLYGSGSYWFHGEEGQGAVNFYKAMMMPFLISPLKNAYLGVNAWMFEESSFVEEDEWTSLGVCNGVYTQHRLYGTAAANHEAFLRRHVTDDCQSRGNSSQCKPLASQTYTVTRSVDLDNCKQRNFVHSHGEGCTGGSGDCHNLASRSSQGVYTVRGGPGGARLEAAEVTGTYVVSPLGYRTEHVRSVTRQTLALVSASAASTPPSQGRLRWRASSAGFDMPFRRHSWGHYFEAASPAEMMENIEGFSVPEELMVDYIKEVVAVLEEAKATITTRNQTRLKHISGALLYVRYLFYDFTEGQFRAVRNALPTLDRTLFYDVLATVGTEAAVKTLLQEFDSLSQGRQVLLFGSMLQSLHGPDAVELLLKHVLKESLDASPFKSSQLLVNFAKFLKHACAPARPDPHSTFPRNSCHPSWITEFRDHVTSKLKTTEKFWAQMVLVKTLVKLQDVRATNTLLPYILGRRAVDPSVRVVAMDALAAWGAADVSQRASYVLTLLDLLENPAEAMVVRATALGRLASWPLSGPEWGRVSLLTRRPGNRDLAGMAYSLILATANHRSPDTVTQMRRAQHALVHARHVSVAARLSSFHTWVQYLSSSQFGWVDHAEVIQDPMSPLPSQLALYTQASYGGVSFHSKVDTMISNDDGNLDNIVVDVLMGKPTPNRNRTEDAEPWTVTWNKLKNGLNLKEKVRGAVKGLAAIMTSSGLELFIPIETEFLHSIQALEVFFGDLGSQTSFTLYSELLTRNLITPTDIGLPLMLTARQPAVISVRGQLALAGTTSSTRHELMALNNSIVYSSEYVLSLTVMAPFARHAVGVGVTSGTALMLPFDLHAFSDRARPRTAFAKVALPANGTKLHLLEHYTQPWIFDRPTTRMNFEDVVKTFKSIHTSETDLPLYQDEMNMTKYVTVATGGDVKHPNPSLEDWLQLFLPTETSPQKILEREMQTCKSSYRNLVLNLPASDFVALTFNHTEVTLESSQDEAMKSFSRSEGGSLSPRKSSYGFTGVESPQLRQHLQHMRSLPHWKGTIEAQGIRIELQEWEVDDRAPFQPSFLDMELQYWRDRNITVMTHSHILEAFYAYTTIYESDAEKIVEKYVGINVNNDPSLQYCQEGRNTDPVINDMDSWDTFLTKKLQRTETAKVYSGEKCSVLVGETNDTRWMSEEYRNVLISEVLAHAASSDGFYDKIAVFLEKALYDEDNFVSEGFHEVYRYPILGGVSNLYDKLMEYYWGVKISNLYATIRDPSIPYTRKSKRVGDQLWSLEQSLGGGAPQTHLVQLEHPWLEEISRLSSSSDYSNEHPCVVSQQKVHTFDGLDTAASLSTCPTLLTTACEAYDHHVFSVAASQNSLGELQVLITAEYAKMVVRLNASGVQVNDRDVDLSLSYKEIMYRHPWRQPSLRVGARVYEQNGYYKVDIDEIGRFILKENKLYIHIDDSYGNFLCGLCGNRDWDATNDMADPRNCALTSPAQFVGAWTPTSSPNCLAATTADTCSRDTNWSANQYTCHSLASVDLEPFNATCG